MKSWKHDRLKDKNEKKKHETQRSKYLHSQLRQSSEVLFFYLTFYHGKFQIYTK